MKKMRCVSRLTAFAVLILALFSPAAALAQETQNSGQYSQILADTDNTTSNDLSSPGQSGNITLTTDYPTIESFATDSFAYNIVLDYSGDIKREFDLKASAPSDWNITFQPQDQSGSYVSSISIDASYSGMSKTVILTATPSGTPAPGDYKILFQAASGNLTGSIELTARIIAKYELQTASVSKLTETTALSGKDNIFSIQLTNAGTGNIDSVTFNATYPKGWEIKFRPDKVDLLTNSDPKTIDVDIMPPAKTKAGDYMISLGASANETTARAMDIRVTVQRPSNWGWVGIAAIVLVIAGLFTLLMRLSRR